MSDPLEFGPIKQGVTIVIKAWTVSGSPAWDQVQLTSLDGTGDVKWHTEEASDAWPIVIILLIIGGVFTVSRVWPRDAAVELSDLAAELADIAGTLNRYQDVVQRLLPDHETEVDDG